MAAPYSQDLRDRVLSAYDRGMRTAEIAHVFGVSRAWARRIKQRRHETGETAPRKMGSPGLCKIDRVRLAELVARQPDATAAELRVRLGVACSESGIYAALKKMGLSFKKRRSTPPSRIVRTWRNAAGTGERISPASTPAA